MCNEAVKLGIFTFLLTLGAFYIVEYLIYKIPFIMFLYSLFNGEGVFKIVYSIIASLWVFLSVLNKTNTKSTTTIKESAAIGGALLLPMLCSCGPLSGALIPLVSSLIGGVSSTLIAGNLSLLIYLLFSSIFAYLTWKEWKKTNIKINEISKVCGKPSPNLREKEQQHPTNQGDLL